MKNDLGLADISGGHPIRRWSRLLNGAAAQRQAVRRTACWFFVAVIALVSGGCTNDVTSIDDGTYYGYELRDSVSPDQPEAIWFNKNVLTVRGDRVQLEKSPGYVLGNEVFSSASDGGFRTFDGTVETSA